MFGVKLHAWFYYDHECLEVGGYSDGHNTKSEQKSYTLETKMWVRFSKQLAGRLVNIPVPYVVRIILVWNQNNSGVE